jgi:hypothetical protein
MQTRAALKLSVAGIPVVLGASLALGASSLDSWALRYVPAHVLSDIAYGAGLFVAAGDVAYSSPDSICWTRRDLNTPPPVNGLTGIAYGNGRFVVVQPAPYHVPGSAYTSADGISWQRSADLPGSNSIPAIERVYFCGGTFLAVGQEPNPAPATGTHWLVMTSPDGVTWTRNSGPTNNGEYYYLNGATCANGIYLVGGRNGLLLASTNLTVWTPVPGFPASVSINGITFGLGHFVAVGWNPQSGEASIVTSPDAVQWSNRLAGIQKQLSAVAFGGDSLVAVGNPGLLLWSTNAVDWTQFPISVDAFSGVTFGNGSFVAVGGYYTDVPRNLALQSGGRPQVCLQPLGFGIPASSGFRLLLTAEGGRNYRLQASSVLPAESWSNVASITFPLSVLPPTVQLTDSTAPRTGQRFYRVVSP